MIVIRIEKTVSILIAVLLATIIIILSFFISSNKKVTAKSEFSEYSDLVITDDIDNPEKFELVSVTDGDTIHVRNNKSGEIKVRYIGIDTPESVHSDESRNTKEGKIASERNKEILEDAKGAVYLSYDVEKYDEYGRTLAYVYVKTSEGYLMVQDILLFEGMAKVMTVDPNTKYSSHFALLDDSAENNNRGFWGTGFFY